MAQTSNYGLKQWESWEIPRRGEVNQLASDIDAALNALDEGKAELVTATYSGNGAETRTITLGFTPQALYILRADGRQVTENYDIMGGLALENHPVQRYETIPVISIAADGFTLSAETVNESGVVYHVLALR